MSLTVEDFTLTGIAFPVQTGTDDFTLTGFAFLVEVGTGTGTGVTPTGCDYPSVADVRLGVTFDNGNLTGTLVLPQVTDVRVGVGYGSGSTEFTGTLTASSGGLLDSNDDPLVHSPADVIRRLLIDLGLGVSPSLNVAWPIYTTSEPTAPDNVITTYDTVGTDDGRSMPDGSLLKHLGFQVRVRSKDHPTGWAKSVLIQAALAKLCYDKVVTMPDSTQYLVSSVVKISDVIALGKEVPTAGQQGPSSKRNIFTINAVASISRLSE